MNNKLSIVFSIIIREIFMNDLICKIQKCTLINFIIYKTFSVVYFKIVSNKLKDLQLIKNQVKYDLKISFYNVDYFYLTNEQVDFLKQTKNIDKLLLNDDKVLIDFIVMHYYFKNKNYTKGVKILR